MACHRIGQFRQIIDLVERNHNLRCDFLIELYILLKLRDRRPSKCFGFIAFRTLFMNVFNLGLEMAVNVVKSRDTRTTYAFHQNLHGTIGKLQ